MSDPRGRVIAGRYRLTSRLGSGAMGAVWLAEDEVLQRTVAVKELLLPPGLDDVAAEQAHQRALREGRIAARMRHINAISVYDVVDDGGRPVLIMEYLPSRSLADVLAEQGSLAPVEVARIGSEVASALNAAHNAGVVHRDVKPANILLGEGGAIKLTDFGISRATGDITVTTTGLLAGSPAYLSPEAARGGEPTPSSDVFSLGATLYKAVEGRLPFGDQDNTIAALHAVAAGHVIPPVQAGPLTEALMSMLHPDPASRPGMPQVQDMLTAVAAGKSPAVEPPTEVVSLPGRGRRGRAAALAIAAAVLASAGAIVLGIVLGSDDKVAGAARGDVSQPTTTTTTTTATSTSSPPEVTAEDLEATAATFYEVITEDTDAGWAMLTRKLQDVGRERFNTYWGNITQITITEGPQADGLKVVVGYEFTAGSQGREYFQRTELGMVIRDGKPMINSMKSLKAERINN